MFEVGTILQSSWGYEQTNINFYKVVKKTDKSVQLMDLKSDVVERGDMCGKVVASDEFVEGCQPFRRMIRDGRDSVKICDYEYASIWDGTPKTFTSYA